MPAFATPEPITVSLDLAAGAVTVVASDREDTVVTVRPSDPGRAGDVKAAEETRVDLHDGTLTVERTTRFKTLTKSSADVTIEVPTGSSLRGSAQGPLFSQGRLGTCSFTGRAGDVRIDEVGRLEVRASAGSVVVGRALGTTDVVAAAGGVRIREIDGDATVKNSTGSTEIGTLTGSLRVNGAHGDVAIDRTLGDVTVKSAHGGIRVEEAVGGSLRLETSYGGIEVGVPEGTAAWVDASSQHGAVRNLLTGAAGPADGERTVEVHASTSFGEVVVRRPHA